MREEGIKAGGRKEGRQLVRGGLERWKEGNSVLRRFQNRCNAATAVGKRQDDELLRSTFRPIPSIRVAGAAREATLSSIQFN